MEEFLDNIWRMVVESNVLHLIWALLILLVGWLLAVVLSNRLGMLLRNWGVGKKLSHCLPEGAHSSAVRFSVSPSLKAVTENGIRSP